MKKLLWLSLLLLPVFAHAEGKLTIDASIEDLQFVKPERGIGKAGKFIFKTVNVDKDGIILNLTNVNNLFDSEIFIRPTFLGFTAQFGSYGFTLDEQGLFNAINVLQLKNSKLLLDENQLNVSGESLKFVNLDNDIKLDTFRLYCQSSALRLDSLIAPPTGDVVKNCLNYLTLNGTYIPTNEMASVEYKTLNVATGDRTVIKGKIKSFDVRPARLSAKLNTIQSTSNDSYVISANEINADCAKDPQLTEVNFEKIQKDCLNDFKLAPLKATLVDKKAKSNFSLDVKDLTIKNKIAYLAMNTATMSDIASTTYINDILLNCKKETDTDILDLMQVLRDCLGYSKISIAEVKSTKPDDNKGSSIKKIAINSTNNSLIIQANVKFLIFTSRVTVYARGSLDESKKVLTLNVTDTKLPLGLTSVKLLMYFLKKNLINKQVTYSGNNIIISLQ